MLSVSASSVSVGVNVRCLERRQRKRDPVAEVAEANVDGKVNPEA